VPVLQSAAIAFVFLGLGCVVSYFFFQSAPVLVVTDRDTRIFCAASFGSSLLFAVLLDESFRIARSDLARWFVSAAAAVFLGILFLYSFVLQNDYVADWAGQRRLIRDMVALTPDLKRDSAILLRLTLAYDSSPVWGRRRGIGNERFIYEQEFGWLCARGGRWPSLFIVYSDAWLQHLKLDADGLLAWTEPTFDGRWLPVTGRFRPGRLIVIDGRQPEHVFRRSEPVQVGGVQIVQPAPDSNPSGATLWSLVPSNDLSQSFFAASSWKAGAVAKRETGDRNPRLSSPAPGTLLLQSPLTLTWTPVPDAVNYWIDVGTGSGLNDIWGGFSNGETSVDVDISRYLTGAAIHVQIYAAFADYHLVPGSGSKYSFATSRGLSPAISGHGGGKATQ
jgi:hypothetical protein